MAISLHEVSGLDRHAFVAAIAHVFEGAPQFVERAWERRPFASVDELYRALIAAMWAAPADAQLALIAAHPDLAGKAAIAGELTPESTREQASAALDRLTPDEYAAFTRLNSTYRERFGFPFIICVREQSKGGILAAFERRIAQERGQEIRTALEEIAKIARLRLDDTVEPR